MNLSVKYRDISLSFVPLPSSGDVSTVSDEKSISQSLKTLIFYNYYDVPFEPTLGSNIRAKLFDLVTDMTSDIIKSDLKTLIENYEPRIELIDIKSRAVPKDHAIEVSLTYRARTSTNEIAITYFLSRII